MGNTNSITDELKSMPSSTDCVICHGPAVTSKALLLQCLHAVCSKKCLNTGDGGIERCPKCKVFIKRDEVSHNTFFRSRACLNCSSGLETVTWCQACYKFYCSECTKRHRLSTASIGHQFGPVLVEVQKQMDEMNQNQLVCPTHGSTLAACLTCPKAACVTCHTLEHSLRPMGDFLAEAREYIRRVDQPLREFLQKVPTKIQKCDDVVVKSFELEEELKFHAQNVAQKAKLLLQPRKLDLDHQVSLAVEGWMAKIESEKKGLEIICVQVQQLLGYLIDYLSSDIGDCFPNHSLLLLQSENVLKIIDNLPPTKKQTRQVFNYKMLDELNKCLLSIYTVQRIKTKIGVSPSLNDSAESGP